MAKKVTEYPVGYQIPIHRSLTAPIYWMGVPRNVLILEALAVILGAVIIKTIWIPLLTVGFHFIFRYLGQHDPQFHEIFWRAKDYKSHYNP